ncbi:glycosyltransferase family 2 protein [Thiovibrio sp. JS02]
MIDIIVPTYRRYELLPLTLKSVQEQTCKNWRCWISEDGCDPKTKACIEPLLADRRFTYLCGEHAGFPARPRNRAIAQGNAEYVAILDDDDLWLPEKLERQLAFLKSHPACAMVGSNGYRWQGEPISPTDIADHLPLYHRKIPYGRIDINLLLRENCFIASSVMIRRAALEKCGLFNEALSPPIGEDIEMWYRLAAGGELWFMGEPLVLYRDLPPKYYDILEGENLNLWRIGLLQAALEGSNIPSPLNLPENEPLRRLFQDKIEFFRTGPHLFGATGYLLKKKLGLLARG